MTQKVKTYEDKSFSFVLYVNVARMRHGSFKVLYRLVRELNGAIQRAISEQIGLFCPLCHASSENIIRYGKEGREWNGDVIRYECKVCGNHFCSRTLSPFYRKHYPEVVILSALVLYYHLGCSIEKISRLVGLPTNGKIRRAVYSTIDDWITEYSYLIGLGGRSIHPNGISDIWEIDEVYKRVNGDRTYILGVIDRENKVVFLKETTRIDEAEVMPYITDVQYQFGRKPSRIESDCWNAYEGVMKDLKIPHGRVKHKERWKSEEGYHDNTIERFWSTFRHWHRKMRGDKSLGRSMIRTSAFEAYYNWIRPHMSLDGRTPMGALCGEKMDWIDLIVKGFLIDNPEWNTEAPTID